MPYAHTGLDGAVKDEFYWGMFKGYSLDGKMRSLAGFAPTTNTTRNTEVTTCTANGSGYYTIYKSGWDYISDLLTLISKSDNSQAKFGEGYSISNSSALSSGTTKATGPFWGSSDGKTDVKVLWIEGYWGNIWESVAGCIVDNGNVKVKMIPPYNLDGSGYTSVLTITSTFGGYVTTNQCNDAGGYIPTAAGSGSATMYTCDYGYIYKGSDIRFLFVCGYWTRGSDCGSRFFSLDYVASGSHSNLASRLVLCTWFDSMPLGRNGHLFWRLVGFFRKTFGDKGH